MENLKEEIKLGDVVWLKSGGPIMTANNWDTMTRSELGLKCYWFVQGQLCEGIFSSHALTKTAPDAPAQR
ncbi:uncharacterized protein YodC (DUF2158 family) [Rhabdobacter roseus]|uniref:Uncharacterized protein YodC (DUF2158 family) n=1 Tax=Rhabdobacter roseus TaxID=1655419 RepID=A0A840U599_9BACT|nr:DUF2158 domain-containing protein [Rhabdobacter roseus]MBB5287488.1 uncharacterized protein YodC (DUF2158 family) [Rhabdobacter roseus]